MSLEFYKVKAAAEMDRRKRAAARSTSSQSEQWRSDPVLFAHEAFGIASWKRQAEILNAVATHKRVAVRAGQKVSKTLSASLAALWFAVCFPGARVIITAPTHRQVDEIVWHEIRRLWRGMRVPIAGKCNESPGGGLLLSNGSEVFGFTTVKPEKMSGFSGQHLMFVVDEASGVSRAIFDAIEGNRAGGGRMLMISNPTQVTGPFYDAFHTDSGYRQIHVSSLESPNVVSGKDVIPGLATREWVEERRREWGESSPMWAARVMGEFPVGSDNSVVSLTLVTQARERWEAEHRKVLDKRLELGVDVARFGSDRTVIFPKRGHVLFAPETFSGQDTVDTAGRILKLSREEIRAGRRKAIARIDDAGVGGGVTDILMRHADDVECVAVNAGESSDSPDEFYNLRTQLYFGMAEFLREGGAIPPGVRGLEAELLEAKYNFDARGRRRVEGKDDIKKRVGRSPDLADAAMIAVLVRDGGESGGDYTTRDFESMPLG